MSDLGFDDSNHHPNVEHTEEIQSVEGASCLNVVDMLLFDKTALFMGAW